MADDEGGSVLRSTIPNTWSLNSLAADDTRRIGMIGRVLTNATIAYGVNMPGPEDRWVPMDVNRVLQLKQVDLGLSLTEMPDLAGYWCWIRHSRGTVDGKPVYAMESLCHPGWYWSNRSTIVSWNTIILIEHGDPSDAQVFFFR